MAPHNVRLVLGGEGARAAEDLAKRYPATKAWSEQGLGTVSDAGDVWRVTSFELGLGKDLTIAGKGAEVVLGRSETNVLWAVVFPDKPAEIESRLGGDGERTEAIFVRFSPYDVGRVFGPGEEVALTTTGLHHGGGGEVMARFGRNTVIVLGMGFGAEGSQFLFGTTWSY